MLTAIVFVPAPRTDASSTRPAEQVVRTLASLVPASLAGLLRDVVIAGPVGGDLPLVADHAGCGLVEAEHEAAYLSVAIARAKQPRALLLRAGYAVGAEFVEELGDVLATEERPIRLRAAAERFGERLLPGLAPVVGVLASTSDLADAARLGAAADFRTRVRRLSRPATFKATARRVL